MSDAIEARTETEKPGLIRASWNLSGDDVQAGLAHCSPEARETMIAAFRWCIDPAHPLARPDFGKRVGYAPNTIYKILTGRHTNPETGEKYDVPADLLKATREFLELERDRFGGGRTEFVATPTWKRIELTCDLARESQTIAILWGPSHIGKTWGLEHYTQANNHGRTYLVKLEAASGLGGMVRLIADACGISDKGSTAELVNRIKRALSPSTLLIIDECHLLQHTYRRSSFFACIEVLRRIHDFSQCGMVLCWTILDNLKAASQGELQQVWRRGVHKVALPLMPTKGDLAAILQHSGLSFPDAKLEVTVQKVTEKPYEVLRQIAKRDGLKAITERLRYARKLARKSGDKLTWENFIDAHLRIEKQAEQPGEWADEPKKSDGGAK